MKKRSEVLLGEESRGAFRLVHRARPEARASVLRNHKASRHDIRAPAFSRAFRHGVSWENLYAIRSTRSRRYTPRRRVSVIDKKHQTAPPEPSHTALYLVTGARSSLHNPTARHTRVHRRRQPTHRSPLQA